MQGIPAVKKEATKKSQLVRPYFQPRESPIARFPSPHQKAFKTNRRSIEPRVGVISILPTLPADVASELAVSEKLSNDGSCGAANWRQPHPGHSSARRR